MLTVRDLMTAEAAFVGVHDSIVEVARRMRDLDVGALPIRGDDDRLVGMVTDRDIAIRVVAEGVDVTSEVGALAQGAPVTVGADAPVEEALQSMAEHGVRRLPVLDGDRLVGMLSQADVARSLDEDRTGRLVEAISKIP